jgi:glycerophosphoryl diester phosphodiesterase
MGNAVVRRSGTVSIVADDLWQFRLGAVPLGVGVVLGASLVALLRRDRRAVQQPPTPPGGDIVLELDVHACADGALVVLHDGPADRPTAAALTQDQVEALDAAHHFTTDGGSSPFRRKIPTVAEVLARFPEALLDVEVAGGRAGPERPGWEIGEGADASRRTMVLATRASTLELTTYRLLALVGATGWVGPVVPARRFTAHEGLRVDVWTVDDEDDVRRLLGGGTDGIASGRPDVVARVLAGATAVGGDAA